MAITVTKPLNNLIPFPMFISGCIAVVLLGVVVAFFEKKISGFLNRHKGIYWICLLIFGVCLFASGLLYGNRWEGVSLADYSQVYQGAMELSKGQPISQEWYFLIYSNNIKPMIFLEWVFRLASFLGLSNPHPLLLCLSVAGVLGAVLGAGRLIEDEGLKLLLLLLFAISLPVWFFSAYFYTDTLSFGLAISSLALLQSAVEKADGKGIALGLVKVLLSAVLLVLGLGIKITVLIPFIALVLVLYLRGAAHQLKVSSRILVLCGVFLIGTLGLWMIENRLVKTYPVWEKAEETANPPISWIALGIKGEGSWSSSYDFIHEITSLETTAEKEALSKQYIIENKGELINPEHLKEKLRFNFASGCFAAHGMLTEARQENLFWQMFAPYGDLYWKTSQICFIYIWMLYGAMLLGSIACLVALLRGKRIPFWLEVAHISFFGIFCFLMLWEANNRQMYNQLPMLVLGAVLGMRFALQSVTSKKRNGLE